MRPGSETTGQGVDVGRGEALEEFGGEGGGRDVRDDLGEVADGAVAVHTARFFVARRAVAQEFHVWSLLGFFVSAQPAVQPPSMMWVCPVTKADSSDAR